MAIANTFQKYRMSHGALSDASDIPNATTRFAGGKGFSQQWYTGGNFYVILQPPDHIFQGSDVAPAAGRAMADLDRGHGSNSSVFEQWTMATCESFTPHSVTPGIVEHVGLGGLKSNFYNGRNDVNNEFSLAFREWQNLPLIQSIMLWASYNNAYYGITSVDGDQFNPSHYKGDAFIICTKPTVSGQMKELTEQDIDQVYYYDGVMPKNVPLDSFNQDITTSETVQISVQFSFDGYPMDKSERCVVERALEEFNNRYKWIHMYDRHYSCQTGPHIQDNRGKMAAYGKRGDYKNPGRGEW
jgi:hypothetical protein